MMGFRARPWPLRIAAVLAILGGAVGALNAGAALIQVGSAPGYDARAVFGWIALGAAVCGATAAVAFLDRPIVAAPVLVVGGLVGTLAINLFYINTFYVAALPLWLAGTALLLVSARS